MKNRTQYYEMLKDDARAVRAKYGLTTGRVLPGEMKKILLAEGVDEIVLWEHFKRVRGAYLIEDDKAIVAVRKGLPIDQYAFTLGHEFKHHRHDRHLGGILCSPSTERDPIEIGAEIFSAEFIYPEQLYLEEILSMGVKRGFCSAEDIVRLKVKTGTTLSCGSLAKRAMFLSLAPQNSLINVRWKKLQEELFGEPFYLKLRRSHRQGVSA